MLMDRGATRRGSQAARLAAPLVLALVGGGLWLLSQGQPARLGDAVGPGYLARGLAAGTVGLAAVWALTIWRACAPVPSPTGCAPRTPAQERAGARVGAGAGMALLGGVLAFALAVPVAGLVAGAGLAAGGAAWATGERCVGALAATMAGLALLAAVIGVLLLPPTAPLWPGR